MLKEVFFPVNLFQGQNTLAPDQRASAQQKTALNYLLSGPGTSPLTSDAISDLRNISKLDPSPDSSRPFCQKKTSHFPFQCDGTFV